MANHIREDSDVKAQQIVDSHNLPLYDRVEAINDLLQPAAHNEVGAPKTQQMVDNLRGATPREPTPVQREPTPVPSCITAVPSETSDNDIERDAERHEEQMQPSVEQLEAMTEGGPGANAMAVDQTEQVTDTMKEKEMNMPAEAAREGIATSVSGSRSDGFKKDQPPTPEELRSKTETALIMAGLCMATFLAALDMTIVTTALPTIAAAFKASSADYTWVGSAYLLAAASATPSWGKISDTFGRKPTILAANIVFFVGSLICALSVSINMLLAGRVIQGIGAGGLISMTQICISDLFSMRTRGMYFGVIGGVWAFASAVGPVLGGVFTELATWRWAFYVNLPCDGAAFLVLLFFLDIKTPTTPFVAGLKAIDWLGSLAIVGGTVMLLLGLEFGGITYPWKSATVICLVVFGIVTMGLFFVLENYVPKYPIMPLRLFNRRNNIAALGTCFFHGFVYISGSYFLPLYFQAVIGASPLLSGVYLFPFVISLSLVSAVTGFIIRKTGQYRPLIWAGLVFQTLGFGLYINFPATTSWPRIIIFQIIAGLGVGTNFQSPLIALQSRVDPRDIASATATFGFVRNLATSISVIVGGVVFQNQLSKYLSTSSLPANLQALIGDGSAGADTGIVSALPPAEKAVALEGYTLALRDMWIFYTCCAFVALLISLMIEQNTLDKTHKETKIGLEEQEKQRLEEKEKKMAARAQRASLSGDKLGEKNV